MDDAHVLSQPAQAKLTAELADLEAKTGHQLVVATIPDLQGYEIEDYGYQLLRTWGIGRKDVNDGAILIVAPSSRKVRIEVGYGLEPVLTDALSNVILQERVLPQFRDGKMEAGIVSGTEAIIEQLALPDDQAKAKVAQAAAPQSRSQGDSGIPALLMLLVVVWVLGGILRGRRGGGLWWLLPLMMSGRGGGGGFSGGGFGGGGFGGGGGGGFSGGGGSGGGGGSSGSW